MKQADPDRPLPPGLDQLWTFLSPSHQLRLNSLDFSDLWDEENLGLDSGEENTTPPTKAEPTMTPPPPPPPAPPPPSPTLPAGRTLRLHWRALQSLAFLPRMGHFGPQTIWAGLEPVAVDTHSLEYLFESKTSSVYMGGGMRRQQCLSVLGIKRSNIITITLSSLPPPHLLPSAILSMDCSVLDPDDLQKLQVLVPSEEELCLIREAQVRSPGLPLAAAERCLTTLGAIPHLRPRLQLWAFTLEYDALEREIAEPLFHIKQAMEQLAANQTFRCILATVLAIGNFLNGCKARGFELSYLGKLTQVRDTHSRLPLLHHVCVLLLQLYPQSSDLVSEITAVTHASKCDYSQVGSNLAQLQSHCKASWEQLSLLEQDGTLRQWLPHFLRESEERLAVLHAVHRRVFNRFHSFLLFLGYSRESVLEIRAEAFCKTVSDFALEYKRSRNAILLQREKERERGTPNIPNPTQECLEQDMLEEILQTPESTRRFDLTLPRPRIKHTGPLFQKMKW